MEKRIFLVGTAFMLLALIGCANASAHIYGDTWSITKTTQLTNNTACDGLPVWSDFGTGLFYASNESGNFDVWIRDADSTNKIQITNELAGEFPLFTLLNNLIYVSKQFGSSNLWVANTLWATSASDVEKIALTNDSYWNTDPALIYVPQPQIYDMQPYDTIDNNVPIISANFSCSYGNVSKVTLSVNDSDVTQNTTITDFNVSYIPTEPLNCGQYNFTVCVEGDRYTSSSSTRYFTIAYITNKTPIGCLWTSTPTIGANISCGFGNVSLVTISVDKVDVTANATVTPSYVNYTPIIPLANGSHNVTVYVESTKGISDSKKWTFVVNPERRCSGGGGGGGVPETSYAPKIIFASNRSGNFDIWMINPDGTGLQQLTSDPSNECSPVGFGSKIVYVSDREGNKDIWIMNNDGSNKEQLTTESSNEYSPTIIHSKIFYLSDHSGNEDIWLMCEEDTNKERLTFSTVDENMPSWSPIGGIIYAARTGVNDDYDLWMMNTNGTGKVQLTNSTANETNPIFSSSPCHLEVAYVTEQDGKVDIWTMELTELGDKVRIWSLVDGYVLLGKSFGVIGENEGVLTLIRNCSFDYNSVFVSPGDVFSLSLYDNSTITGTVNRITTFEDRYSEVELVNVTLYSDTGEVLISNATKILTNAPIPLKVSTSGFDTNEPANPYPSIFGTHNGTITPSVTIKVSKLYTYPCVCTGGHTEYVRFWNDSWNVTANWSGYNGDWHNVTFGDLAILYAGLTYNYTIKTGAYPQIHHTDRLEIYDGVITCDEFLDANGKGYTNWIPAIRLD